MFLYNYFMDRDFSRLCTQDGYHHRGHSKTKLLVHLVFVTKYRKLILTGSFGIDVKQILFEAAKRHQWYIQAMETDKGHIHILLQYPPGDSIRHIVSILKQESTYYIWRTHHHKILAQHYWAESTLWSDGYFAASIGDASAETIRQYIASQG
ncbi:MAG: IS200/IS605 family transposase [Lachnospiraceae bacterium]|nr:IS200/IS605 family transposase [Lachnospiraceae bacterium]